MKNRYFPTAVGLYFNYFVHGMGVILMSLNMSSLEQQWHTSAAGVSIVISSLGIGRLSVLLIAGMLSDRFGRRPFIILGTACYLIFFIGILYAQTIFVAYACGFLAGMANSFLDAGTYPSLMEAFPRSPSTANILIKAFVSGGQFLLPIIISLLVWANMWFGWSFLLAGAIMLSSVFITLSFSTLSWSDIEAQNLASACHRRTSLLPHRSYQLHPLWLYLDGNLLSYQPVAGAVWTVRRRNVVYPIHQTVKYLYLRIATVRFYYCPAGQKNNSLYHIIDVLYLYLFYCASDGLPASSGLCCYDLRIRHWILFRRWRSTNRPDADGGPFSTGER